MDAEATVPGSRAGTERGSDYRTGCADTRVRTHLLLGHLSVRHHAGHLRMVGQETEKEPLHVLEGNEVATLPCARAVHHCPRGRHWHAVPAAGPLLCLRTHCHLPSATRMDSRQQCAGKYCGALRQLCVLSLEEVKKFPEYVDFSSKLRYLYEAIGSSFSSDISYPWVTYLVSGMTSKEVQDLSQEAADYWLEQDLGEETWTSPADLKGQAGELAVTFKTGIRTVPEMQDLYQTLMANGIDVYVCSASFIDVIVPFATHAKYGYQVPKEQVYAMELKKNAEGIIQVEMDPDYDQTQGKGKTDTIIKFIAPKHENVTPILVAGDSNGDVAMLSDFPDLQVGLIFNRVKDGGIGKLAKEATESAGNKDQRYFLQGRDENKGQLIPSSKSILLGETEEKLLNVAK